MTAGAAVGRGEGHLGADQLEAVRAYKRARGRVRSGRRKGLNGEGTAIESGWRRT